MFQIGRPIGATQAPDNASLIVAQTVVSVGPYALIIRRPCDQRATTSAEQASPATINVRSGTSSDNSPSSTGGSVAWVTFCSQHRRVRPSPPRSAAATTSVAPDPKAITISEIAASKLGEAN